MGNIRIAFVNSTLIKEGSHRVDLIRIVMGSIGIISLICF